MTFDRIIRIAKENVADCKRYGASVSLMEQFIVDTLGADAPCTFTKPRASRDARGPCVDDDVYGRLSIDETRGIAVAMLRAADEAEQLERARKQHEEKHRG
jgi:hypothetical protein